jgi:hypothetical protein
VEDEVSFFYLKKGESFRIFVSGNTDFFFH